jgi:hypothetical protein
MTKREKPARGTGLSVAQSLGSTETSETSEKPQGVLFGKRTRADALYTAQQLNAAAARNRQAALEHPDHGAVMHRVAALYAKQAADWFGRADALAGVHA